VWEGASDFDSECAAAASGLFSFSGYECFPKFRYASQTKIAGPQAALVHISLIYCTITTKGSRYVTRHLKCSLESMFILRKITLNGGPANAGAEFLTFSDLFGPPNREVTVTRAKIVRFITLCHLSPEPLVVTRRAAASLRQKEVEGTKLIALQRCNVSMNKLS
jgi:hypothetical protein